jgi:hypothetical protein
MIRSSFVPRHECTCIIEGFLPRVAQILLRTLPGDPNCSMRARHVADPHLQPAIATHPHIQPHHPPSMASGKSPLAVENRIVPHCFSFARGRHLLAAGHPRFFPSWRAKRSRSEAEIPRSGAMSSTGPPLPGGCSSQRGRGSRAVGQAPALRAIPHPAQFPPWHGAAHPIPQPQISNPKSKILRVLRVFNSLPSTSAIIPTAPRSPLMPHPQALSLRGGCFGRGRLSRPSPIPAPRGARTPDVAIPTHYNPQAPAPRSPHAPSPSVVIARRVFQAREAQPTWQSPRTMVRKPRHPGAPHASSPGRPIPFHTQ